MKKFIITLVLILFSANIAFCEQFDYEQTYRDMPVPTFSYIHGIDPGQYYDCKRYTSVPYPLLRLASPIYFKNITIPQGYYYVTPREYKGQDYILVKEQGLVKYILPTYKKDFVPEGFYDAVLPKPMYTPWQKFQAHLSDFIGKISKRSRREAMPKFYLEMNDLGNNFVSLTLYYKEFRYYTIIRTVPL